MTSIRFRVPVYCDNYKNVLVEELVYIENPVLLHYGKCAVIGKLLLEQSKYCLSNLELKCLGNKFQNRTGSARLTLIPSSGLMVPLPIGANVEVFGETCLWRVENEANLQLPSVGESAPAPVSPHHLMSWLRNMQLLLEEELELPRREPSGTTDESMHSTVRSALGKQLIKMKRSFAPALQIHSVRAIDQGPELIEANLKLRLIGNKRRETTNGES